MIAGNRRIAKPHGFVYTGRMGENMPEQPKSEALHLAETRARLIAAALPHVAFDGWGAETLGAAIADAGVDPGLARLTCPRGGVDLALAFHQAGDATMVAELAARDLSILRYRDRVALAIKLRLQAVEDEKEAVRKGVALLSLPQHAADGARAIWETADKIWTALGDTSQDLNWYTKRMTLSAVYSSTVLFWLGDVSEQNQDTWDFLDRRIDDVMAFEGFKARMKKNTVIHRLLKGPGRFLDTVKAPDSDRIKDLPGYISEKENQ